MQIYTLWICKVTECYRSWGIQLPLCSKKREIILLTEVIRYILKKYVCGLSLTIEHKVKLN